MNRMRAEELLDFHCSDPKGVMIRARGSLVFEERAFQELVAAIRALEEPYGSVSVIPRRVAACLADLPAEVRALGAMAETAGDLSSARSFAAVSSQISDAISKALWPGTERLNEFGANPIREGSESGR